MGGVEAIEKINRKKAELIYQVIDQSNGFYLNAVKNPFRSMTNITFHMQNPELEKLFIQKAEQENLLQLAGHKLVGGIRASLYNAMPLEGAAALASFMKDFILQREATKDINLQN